MQLFCRNSFAATSINDIITSTGVHSGSIYAAFADKEAVFLAALRTYTDVNQLGRMLAGTPGISAIKNWLTSLYEDLL